MAFVDQEKYPSRRAISIGGVVLVHLAIGYALVTGLAYQVIKKQITVIWATEIESPKPPPPNPTEVKQKTETKVTVPMEVDVKNPSEPTGPIFDRTDPTPTPKVPIVELPTAPVYSRLVQVKGDRGSWVTTDDYPSSAIRDGEEGRVEILARVGTDGRVTSCRVTGTSGHPSLDEATCRYYAKRARFTPALGADGTAVEASYVDRVRWQLPAQ